jgi:hypothetical protein
MNIIISTKKCVFENEDPSSKDSNYNTRWLTIPKPVWFLNNLRKMLDRGILYINGRPEWAMVPNGP